MLNIKTLLSILGLVSFLLIPTASYSDECINELQSLSPKISVQLAQSLANINDDELVTGVRLTAYYPMVVDQNPSPAKEAFISELENQGALFDEDPRLKTPLQSGFEDLKLTIRKLALLRLIKRADVERVSLQDESKPNSEESEHVVFAPADGSSILRDKLIELQQSGVRIHGGENSWESRPMYLVTATPEQIEVIHALPGVDILGREDEKDPEKRQNLFGRIREVFHKTPSS